MKSRLNGKKEKLRSRNSQTKKQNKNMKERKQTNDVDIRLIDPRKTSQELDRLLPIFLMKPANIIPK